MIVQNGNGLSPEPIWRNDDIPTRSRGILRDYHLLVHDVRYGTNEK